MDIIADIRNREQAELAERLASYDETVMIMSHDGDIMDVPDFQVARAKTIKDLVTVPPGTIVAIGTDDVDVASCVMDYSEILGMNIAVIQDVPQQVSSPEVSAKLGMFRPVSFMRVLNDIADQRLVEQNMTTMEIELSQAKKADSMLRTKSGKIRPLIDFDRSFEDGPDEEVEATDDE